MAMDFFAAQQCARRNTVKLALLFGLAIVFVLLFTDLVLYYALVLLQDASTAKITAKIPARHLATLLWINLGVVALIAGGTAYKISALSSGGDAVAHMLGGEPIFRDDPDPVRTRLLNIVDEMAIAAGVPAPQIYVLPEAGINAFAAGFEPSDTVIGVTRGALERLNRDQLQGVVAHEFSHILSGDMRLNVRLAGVLHGLMLLALIGRDLCRSGGSGFQSRRSISAPVLGMGLLIAGYTGYACGRLIKAAICRQREYLADAAAVQFTRNPEGIGGALLQIGASSQGGTISHHKSEQMSHAFFCEGQKPGFFSWALAVHPPLEQRIHRLLPGWNGVFPKAAQIRPQDNAPEKKERPAAMSAPAMAGLAGAGDALYDHTITSARDLRRSLPEPLRKAARDPFAARALLFFLVLDDRPEVGEQQLTHLKKAADRGVHAELRRLLSSGARAEMKEKIPLAELALPQLRTLSTEQARLFYDNLQVLIRADQRISLFEWCLAKMVLQYVAGMLPNHKATARHIHALARVAEAAALLFSAFAYLAANQEYSAEALFNAACTEAGLDGQTLRPAAALDLSAIDGAVDQVALLSLGEQERLLRGCTRALANGDTLAQKQWELLRGLYAALAAPMPLMDDAG